MKQKRHLLILLVLITVALGSAVTVLAKDGPSSRAQTIEFDVSEDMYRFVFDDEVAYEDGLPAHGSAFITQGYIYPKGTLNGSNGVNPDGSPEFPDKVMGQWTCRGFFVGEGAHATTGAWVITTQIFNFGDTVGEKTIVSEGYEIADLNELVTRAITGGTGEYRGARGQGTQELLGFNATEGVNLRIALQVRK